MKTTFQSIRLALGNLRQSAIILLLDVLFVILILSLNMFLRPLALSLNLPKTPASLAVLLLLSLVYYLILIFIYSLFKLQALRLIHSMEKKPYILSWEKLAGFFGLNALMSIIIMAIMAFAGYFLANIRQGFSSIASVLFFFIFIILTYIFLNMSQSSFPYNNSVRISIKSGFKSLLKRKPYYILLQTLLIAILLAIPYYFGFENTSGSLQQYIVVVFMLLLYLVLFVNRISFCRIAE